MLNARGFPPDERAELVALCSLPGATPRRVTEMLSLFGTPAEAWRAARRGSPSARALKEVASSWPQAAAAMRPREDLRRLEERGIGVVLLGEPQYPCLLGEVRNAPWVLYHRGKPPTAERPTVAVVGSRKASPYGLEVARMLGRELAGSGVEVVSGAAHGIDSSAHRGALEAGSSTTAVLGCGVDVAYPPSSRSLLSKVACAGCILSQYPPGTEPEKYRFPERNRIIAGMSRAVVVVEAANDSGALLTADYALAEGREVLAVPGPICSETSRGTNDLIRGGATVVTDPEHVLEEIGLDPGEALARTRPDGAPGGDARVRRLLHALKRGPADAEELSLAVGFAVPETLSLLALMEVKGEATRGPGGIYYPSMR
jgi:DNA processing protein